MIDFSQEILDTFNPETYSNNQIPTPQTSPQQHGFLSTALHSALAGLENVVSGTADYLGANLKAYGDMLSDPEDSVGVVIDNSMAKPISSAALNTGRVLADNANEQQLEYGDNGHQAFSGGKFAKVLNPDYWTNPRGATYDIANGLGSLGGMLLEGAALPEVKTAEVLEGAEKYAPKLVSLFEKVGDKAPSFVKNMAPDANWALKMGPIESVSNAGGIYDDLKNQGYSDYKIATAMNEELATELPIDAFTEGIEGGILKGRSGLFHSKLLNIPTNAGINTGTESLQEATQQMVQNYYSNHPIMQGVPDVAVAAGLSGGLFGAGGTMLGHGGNTTESNSPQSAPPISGNAGLDSQISAAADANGVPRDILFSLVNAESGFNQSAKSGAGAIGLTQLMPDTAKGLGVNPYDAAENLQGGAKYLKQMYDATGSWHDALIAYNEGLGAFEKGERCKESTAYANEVMRVAGEYANKTGKIIASSTNDSTQNGADNSVQGIPTENTAPNFSNAHNYYKEFAEQKRDTASTPQEINFFHDMFSFDKNGELNKFNDTPANRQAIQDAYGKEFKEFIAQQKQSGSQLEQAEPVDIHPTKIKASQIQVPDEQIAALAKYFDTHKRKPHEIATFLENIANDIIKLGSPREQSMFADEKLPTLIDLINANDDARQVEHGGKPDVDSTANKEVEKKLAPETEINKSTSRQKPESDNDTEPEDTEASSIIDNIFASKEWHKLEEQLTPTGAAKVKDTIKTRIELFKHPESINVLPAITRNDVKNPLAGKEYARWGIKFQSGIDDLTSKYINGNYRAEPKIENKEDAPVPTKVPKGNPTLTTKGMKCWLTDNGNSYMYTQKSRLKTLTIEIPKDANRRDISNIVVNYLKEATNRGTSHPDLVLRRSNEITDHITATIEKFNEGQKTPLEMKKPEEKPETISSTNKGHGSFGDADEARDNLFKTLGIKPKKTIDIIDDSVENEKRLLDELNKALSQMSANPIFNPKIIVPAFQLGCIYMQRGANTITDFSKEILSRVGDKMKPWIKPTWAAIEAYPKDKKINPEHLAAAMKYVGAMYEKTGNVDSALDDFKKQAGIEAYNEYEPLLKAAVAGVNEFKKGVTSDGLSNKPSGTVGTRDSKRDNQDGVGKSNGSKDPDGRRRTDMGQSTEGKSQSEPERNNTIHASSTDTSGEISNSTIRGKKPASENNSAGDTELSRSITDSYEGKSDTDEERPGAITTPTQNRPKHESDIQQNIISKEEASHLKDIQDSLPFLFPEQQNDVLFAENAFGNGKLGVLFTNGTGTGKTFTGMGVVKRFAAAGKNNILIVAPSQKIIDDWISTAKKSFNLEVTQLVDTKDKGHGVTITTYANLGSNEELYRRQFDLVVADESHMFMSSENGAPTDALDMLRAITYNHRGVNAAIKIECKSLYDKIAELRLKQQESKTQARENKIAQLDLQINKLKKAITESFKQKPDKDKSKVVFLSATPFAYVPDVDYAEGYLFDYDNNKDYGGYNQPDGQQAFFIQNFGYRMRYNKLTKPDAEVDNSIMETQFHEKLRQEGVLSGRCLTVDKDYDRGFILVDGGVGKAIDEGFEKLSDDKKYNELYDYFRKNFTHYKRMYLLEAIKAKAAIPLIKEYIKDGKKVVVFHDYKKGGSVNPFSLGDYPDEDIARMYSDFEEDYPELAKMHLKLPSPIETLSKTFGDELLIFNGDIPKKIRSTNVQTFNNDGSGKNIILVQSDAGQAGISLHDTTGKHQRVLINLGLPTKPVAAIQIEGRIYRVGNKTNAIFRYLNTGTNMEKYAFADKIAQRASTAENLALGEEARALKESFINAFEESETGDWKKYLPGSKTEGTGGKEADIAFRQATTPFEKAKTYYFSHSKKTNQTRSAEGSDYFATPEPLGYKMVEWANIKPGERVLEPSAGHGAIARWFPENTENTAIEPSARLVPSVKMAMRKGTVKQITFEDYHISNKHDCIVMNPPFGKSSKTAVEHIAKAFKHLKNGGRLVAILPDSPSSEKRIDKWLLGELDDKDNPKPVKNAYLVAEIKLPSVTFKRAGTTVNCKILVIDKYDTPPKYIPNQSLDFSDADNINDFFDNIEDVSIEPRQKAEEIPEKIELEDGLVAHPDTLAITGNTYQSRVKLKKAHAKWNGDNKSWVFKNKEDFNSFIEYIGKASLSKVGKYKIEQAETPPSGRVVDLVAQKLGVKLHWFKSAKQLHGFTRNGEVYINVNSATSISWTFWHELFHIAAARDSTVANDMISYMLNTNAITQEQIDAYNKELGTHYSNEEAAEEILADAMPVVAKRLKIMQDISDNESLFTRVVEWVKTMLNYMRDCIHAPKVKLTSAQIDNMSDKFMRLVNDVQTSKESTNDTIKTSIEKQSNSWLSRITNKVFKHKVAGNVTIIEPKADKNNRPLWISSPSRIAESVPAFKQFFRFAKNAMNELSKNRSFFERHFAKTLGELSKQERNDLYDILWQGDMQGKEFTADELKDAGASDDVVKAYKSIRALLNRAYTLINNAKTGKKKITKALTPEELKKIKQNKFVSDIKDNGNGTYTYQEKKNWAVSHSCISKDEVDAITSKPYIVVKNTVDNGDGTYTVTTRECTPDVHKLKGYIPHYFHDFMVTTKITDGDKTITKVIGSGESLKKAIDVANEYAKEHPDADIKVSPKIMDFGKYNLDENQYASIVGDKDYSKVVKKVAEQADMTLPEAKEAMQGTIKLHGRHRYLGNLQHRTGATGFEKNMEWVLRHYFNSAARYAALEAHFKPQAYTLFERMYGSIYKEYNGVPNYIKKYIQDVNGNPSAAEMATESFLRNCKFTKPIVRYMSSKFGERFALDFASTITGKITIAKLGFFNVSSALINLTQLLNSAAYLGHIKYASQMLHVGSKHKYTYSENKVLEESGVLNDIGIDSAGGYSKFSARGRVERALQHTMWLFKTMEGIIRRGTVLTAYNKAIKDGLSHKEAVEYARDINEKSNFDYSVADAPNIFRRGGIWSQLFLQFKKYPVKEIETMLDFLPGSKLSRKQKIMYWGSYALMAGLLQWPFTDFVDWCISKLFGIHLKDAAVEYVMQNASNPVEKKLGEIALYGLGALGDIDVSSRVGLADIVPDSASDLAGPTISTAYNSINALLHGDVMGAIRSFSPGLGNIMVAATGKSVGYRGRTISRYDNVSRLLRLLGFRSIDEANASYIQDIEYNNAGDLAIKKQNAIDDYIANPTTANAARLKALHIKPGTVKKERLRKKQTKMERIKDTEKRKKTDGVDDGILDTWGNNN